MAEISLRRARTIIKGALNHGREQGMKPLAVVILDAGGYVKAFEREDGASNYRFDIACALPRAMPGCPKPMKKNFDEPACWNSEKTIGYCGYTKSLRIHLPHGLARQSISSSDRLFRLWMNFSMYRTKRMPPDILSIFFAKKTMSTRFE